MYWEEPFLNEDIELHADDGVLLGVIRPSGAPFIVMVGENFIAMRPDKASAQRALVLYAERGTANAEPQGQSAVVSRDGPGGDCRKAMEL